jgi:MinD superfamily P-loop ATPase
MKIAVASGKGGTGKTLVATSLAFSLKASHKVQYLDCDVEEPNGHIFLRPQLQATEAVCMRVPEVAKKACISCGRCAEVCAYHAIAVLGDHVLTFPQLCHGCGACAYACPPQAITEVDREMGVIERGLADGISFVQGRLAVSEAMAPPVIREVRKRAAAEGIVIIDAPPGTSCPVIESVRGCDFCLLVTEPTPFGLNDLALAVSMVKELGLPCGVVINRSGDGDAMTEAFCKREEIPVLLTIPLDREIAGLYSRGLTLAEGLPAWQKRFRQLAAKITEIVHERACCPQR